MKNPKLYKGVGFFFYMKEEITKECFVCFKQQPKETYIKRYKNGVICEYNTCLECRRVFIKSQVNKDNKQD